MYFSRLRNLVRTRLRFETGVACWALARVVRMVPVRVSERVRGKTIVGLVTLLCLAPASVHAQCTLSSPSTWNIAGNGTWSTAGDWNPAGAPNSTTTNVCITNGTSTVTLDISPSIANLQLASGNTLNMTGNVALTVNGTSIINAGAISMNGGNGTNTFLA